MAESCAAMIGKDRATPPIRAPGNFTTGCRPCFYCGCNKVVTHQLSRVDGYVRHLLEEVGRRGAYFDRGRVVEQMHFGGGTPTFLPKKRLIELIDRIDGHFQLTDDPSRDYSIEIDPRHTDHSMLQLLAALGFNRI